MSNLESFIKENVDFESDDPIVVFNVEDVISKHKEWLEALPRVKPYYAIKANRFPLLLDVMIALGLRFDCASQFEMSEVLNRGAKPEDIIFANPIKTNTFLKYSKNKGIDLMTFVNEEELTRIEPIFPEARLVLRIKVDDSYSTIRLGEKYGADPKSATYLLQKAKGLGLNVVGVAFHVGSGCQNSRAYAEAIRLSRTVFDSAIDMGFQMTVLDIGGGFAGSDNNYLNKNLENNSTFEEMAKQINISLNEYYPGMDVSIIGEPGRYYCESAFVLMTKIISKTTINSNDEKTVAYYLNDGIFGSFNIGSLFENRIFEPVPFSINPDHLKSRQKCLSILWGPSLAQHDVIRNKFTMPQMNIGEWILFENMGAYLMNYSEYGFNGMPSPKIEVYLSKIGKNLLMKTKNWQKIQSNL